MKTAPVTYPEKPEVFLGDVPEIKIPELTIHYKSISDERFGEQVTASHTAVNILRDIYPEGEVEIQEQFIILYLNRRNKVIGFYRHSKGGITGTLVDVRLVLAVALKAGAVSMILSHNHPSGNVQPSKEDISLTKKIKQAAEHFDISLYDHIILTMDSYFSFADEGILYSDMSGINESKLPISHQQFMDQVSERIERGVRDNKLTMEKLAASLKINDKTIVKELLELVIVNTARTIAQRKELSLTERYKQIVRLYENQVNLSHRTSQSILLQQYSTPAPIGFLAGLFCGIDEFTQENGKTGFEPSAGNGLLTIAATPYTFIVNEIDRTRNLHLQTQGYKEVYQVDATQAFSKTIGSGFTKQFDAVITNPPFGRADTKIEFDGYPIGTLEHVMTIRALNTMKDEGKAAIIIGGHTRYDAKKRVEKGAQRVFLNYLYHHYHVADIIPINGAKLYSRQGTSFDTRLILIAGRKEKPNGYAPVYDSYRDTEVKRFDELFERVMEAKKFSSFEYAEMENKKEIEVPIIPREGKVQAKWNYLQKAYTAFWNAHMNVSPGSLILIESDGNFYAFGHSAVVISIKTEIPTHPINIVGENSFFITIPSDQLDVYLDRLSHQGEEVYLKRTTKNFRASMEEEMALIEKELQAELERLKNGEELGAPYLPASEACVVLNTVVPDSMEYETKKALDFIRQEVGGSIDEFVRQRLGYASKIELCKSLSAEQTDAVAMAIYNIEARNQGMIIGDQTGIGKGRIAAAMIRYAVLQGHKPVFITEKPNLFSDIYRDLSAIGSSHLVPFIVNGRESKTDIKDENGEIIHQALPSAEQQQFFKDQRVPAYCDFVVGTYTQFNSPDKKPEKPNFLRAIAQDNVLILDESHNASGSSQTGEFLQKVVEHAMGVIFLSATFAKRPDNMPIYAMKTAIADANMTKEDLVNAISKGGVALQEVLASQLVKEGQMLRRERSFEGVEVNYISLDELETEHKAIADNITELLREIIAFQTTSVDTLVDELDEIAVAEGKEVNLREGTSQAGVDNLPYFSKVFQVINQMLFSIKAEAVADRAILRLKEGKKPVIAFASTMGSFIEQMENEQGLPVSDGDTINADFSEVLMRGLDGILRYTVTTPEGKKEFKKFDLSELSEEARKEYLQIAEKIKRLSSGISISPIDIIVQKLKSAGYTVAEVTGRKYEVQINTKTNKGLVRSRNRINTNDAFRQFNNNEVDVLMINQSGSTGASAHAIVTKKVSADEVRQRVMIVLQAELDINTEVQKRGRINRTGQILPPIYDYMMSTIPAEKRLMMMLQKKLKSLDANTTSNQKQSTKILDVPDFLNKFGDKIVTQYLSDNPDINKLLGDPLGLADTSNENGEVLEDAAHKVSGRVAVLSTKMQAEFYTEVSQAYNEYVEYLKQIGEYDLEVEAMNLEAETISQKVVRMGKGGDSEFGTDSILEKVNANVLKKPFSKIELANILAEALGIKEPEQIQKEIIKSYEDFAEAQLKKDIAETELYYEEQIKAVPKEKKALKIKEKDGQEAFLKFIKEREKELKEAEAKQLAKVEQQMKNRMFYLNSIFKFFFIGKNISYPVSSYGEGDIIIPSVFAGFIIDSKKKNPYAPSNIRLRFALASSNKYIAIPASYTKDINAIMGASHSTVTDSMEDTLSAWEKAIKSSDKSRAIRYIVTGNLLQAFADFKGKLVSYTTNKGETNKGILMPEYWESEGEMEDKVSVPINRAAKVIQSLVKGNSITTDNGTGIYNTGDTYKIIVPSSKQKGGDVFLDKDILEMVEGNNFNKVSTNMVAYLPHNRIAEFLNILQQKFNDSVKLDMHQFNLIKNIKTEHKERNKIKLLSPEEVAQEEELHLMALAVEVELELELEIMRLRQAA